MTTYEPGRALLAQSGGGDPEAGLTGPGSEKAGGKMKRRRSQRAKCEGSFLALGLESP